jgi:hypothetical protein
MNDDTVSRQQKLRRQRFGMALSTYAVVSLAAFLITKLGLGHMAMIHWVTFVALAVFGNLTFFALFYTSTNLRFADPSLTREQIVYSACWGLVPLYAMPEARPIILLFYLPAFSFGMLRLRLRQYLWVVACVMGLYAFLLVVEYLQHRPGFRIQYELFLFVLFAILLLWFALFGGFVSDIRRRLQIKNAETRKAHEAIQIEMEERRRAQLEKDKLIVELQQALQKVKTLSGLLPICTCCKKIRDDEGYWKQIESYISEHSEVDFSHSICPECAAKLYPDMEIY